MKKISFFLFSATVLLATACSDAPEGDNASIQEQQQAANAAGTSFTVDTTDSRIRFTGYGVGKSHPGILKLDSGTVTVAQDKIASGNFVIDVRSLEMEEKGEMFEDKLRPHLLSGDFFDAEKFGTARFEITNVTAYEKNDKDSSVVEGANYNISGNLTLKDVTKNVTFPARVDLDGDVLKAKGNFDIDRRQWQMNYGNDKTLGDKFISEKVNIELDLKAKKSAQ